MPIEREMYIFGFEYAIICLMHGYNWEHSVMRFKTTKFI